MVEAEYIILKVKIARRSYGSEKIEELEGMHLNWGSSGLSEKFKQMLWDDYSIEIDNLLEKFGDTKDPSTLLIDD